MIEIILDGVRTTFEITGIHEGWYYAKDIYVPERELRLVPVLGNDFETGQHLKVLICMDGEIEIL